MDTWSRAERILCVRPDGLGDVLMTSPALRALRQSVPGRRLSLLCSAAGAHIAHLLPEVDEVLVYAAPWVKTSPPHLAVVDVRRLARLRRGHFDAAVIFTTFSQSPLPAALLCYLANIPLRLAHCRENPYQLLTDWVPETEPERGERHEVRRQLDLVAEVGSVTGDERLSRPEVPLAARRRVAHELRRLDLEQRRDWVLIHPGATAISRRYRPAGFAAAADHLVARMGWRIVFAGASADAGLVDSVRASMRAEAVSLAGRLDLAELIALIERAPVLIANNSGPAHIAAAVGTPVVDLYALTNPQHTPWQSRCRVLSHPVPCAGCLRSECPLGHNDCLQRVPPEAVAEAACELAAEAAG
jgi:lipopolysaccharide heptosyltransferase II